MNDVYSLKREKVIDELRRFAHPSWFHSLLTKDTVYLQALLGYYLQGGTEKEII